MRSCERSCRTSKVSPVAGTGCRYRRWTLRSRSTSSWCSSAARAPCGDRCWARSCSSSPRRSSGRAIPTSTRSSSARSSSPWCCSCRAACSASSRSSTGCPGPSDLMASPPVLEIERLRKRFGGVTAVDGVSLRLEPARIYGLIGPNGSGKTTLFNCITGVERLDEGRDPALIRLEEPAAGVNRTLLNDLLEAVRQLRDRGKTILLVEHDMKVVMGLCETVFVLDHGEKIAEGAPGVIQTDERVIEAYFGR